MRFRRTSFTLFNSCQGVFLFSDKFREANKEHNYTSRKKRMFRPTVFCYVFRSHVKQFPFIRGNFSFVFTVHSGTRDMFRWRNFRSKQVSLLCIAVASETRGYCCRPNVWCPVGEVIPVLDHFAMKKWGSHRNQIPMSGKRSVVHIGQELGWESEAVIKDQICPCSEAPSYQTV